MGWMVDSFGRRRFLLVGLVIFSLSTPFYSLATAFNALIVLRVIQGIGWATLTPAVAMMTADVLPRNRRGEGIGYTSSARSLALAIGPAVSLYLSQSFGYGVSFIFASAICFLGLPVCWPISESYTPPKSSPRFLIRDLIEMSAVGPSLVTALMTFVFGGLVTFIPLDAQNRDLGNAAIFFVIFAIGLTFLRPFFGHVADRLSNRGAILVSGLLLVVASPLSLFFTVGPWTLPLAAIFWALGFGSVQPIIRVMILERAPQNRWGSAAATTSTAWEIGFTLGAVVLGILAEKIGIPSMFAFSSLAGVAAIFVVFLFRLHRDINDSI